MRTALVATLLGVGFVAMLIGNLGLWAERTVFNTSQFASTTSSVLDQRDVQERTSAVLAAELVRRAEVSARIQQQLPEGLGFLAQPLTTAARDFIAQAVLRVMDERLTPEVKRRILEGVHGQVMATLKGETAVGSNGDVVYLDLHDVLVAAAEAIGIQADPNQGLLARVDLPPEAGRVVISTNAQRFDRLSWVATHHRAIGVALVGLPVVLFALAILAATNRRRTTRTVGFLVLAGGIVSLVLLIPLRSAAGDLARDPSVGRETFSIVVGGFRLQSFLLILLGAVIVAAATFLGRSRRASVRLDDTDAWRQRLPQLRLAGFGVAAVVLIAWPSPTWRIYAATAALLVAYLALLWAATSDSEAAARAREHGALWKQRLGHTEQPKGRGLSGRIASRAPQLRIGGIVVALLLLVFWPDLTWRGVVALAVCALLYLAAIDWAVRETRSGDDSPPRHTAAPQGGSAPPPQPDERRREVRGS